MSAVRRSSLQDTREKLGEPFQIYTEVVNAGKTVQGTKKKVKWLFGFSNGNEEHEVVLVLSILSGKKVIFEDGKEIVNTTSMLNTDFGHGWSSLATRRLYRVEANLTMNGELAFIFSVDGVPYIDFPQKHQLKRTGSSHLATGRYGDEATETSASAPRRPSTGSVPTTQAASRPVSSATSSAFKGAHSSTSKPNEATFDPFSANNSASFDPFADDFGSTPAAPAAPAPSTAHSHQKQSPVAAVTVAKKPPVATKTTPTAAAHRASLTPKPSANALLFDEIPADSSNSNSGGFDAFDSSDPFTASAPPAGNSNNSAFDPFAPSAPAPVVAHKLAINPPTKQTGSSSAAFDPFGSSTDSFAASHGSAAPYERGSALDDFAGLSFSVAPAPVTLPVSKGAIAGPVPAVEKAPVAVKNDAPKDPWQTNLVDLDLSGRTKEQVRRTSVVGPSLKDLMQQAGTGNNSSNNNIGGSFNAGFPTTNSNDPFGAPAILQATSSTGFPVASHDASNNGFRPTSTADTFSSLGLAPPVSHPPANMRDTMGMGIPPTAPSMSMGGNSMGGGRPMSGAPAAGNVMGGGMGRSSFIMPPNGSYSGPAGINSNQPKSSLDSLDWRAMS
jgi:hypothetical protein